MTENKQEFIKKLDGSIIADRLQAAMIIVSAGYQTGHGGLKHAYDNGTADDREHLEKTDIAGLKKMVKVLKQLAEDDSELRELKEVIKQVDEENAWLDPEVWERLIITMPLSYGQIIAEAEEDNGNIVYFDTVDEDLKAYL